MFLCLFAWCLEAGAAEPGAAQPDPDTERARQLFENGRELYAEGEYMGAIEAWTAAYELSKLPDLLFNVSSAYEKLGNYAAAIDALNRYRVFATAEEAETISRKLRALEARMSTEPASATESVADVTTAPGDPPESPEPTPPKRRIHWAPITAVVLGSAVSIASGVVGVGALSSRGEVHTTCVDTSDGWLCPGSVDPEMQRYRSLGTLATIGLATGGGLMLTGVGVLVFSDPSDASPRGVALTGRF